MKTYKVSELIRQVQWLLEDTYGAVAVEGEVSEVTRSRRGHLYFILKDAQAELRCVMWSSAAAHLAFNPETGRMFTCFGKLTVYPARGAFQMDVKRIEPQGLGALKLALEQRTKKLEAEGFFAEERKKPLPVAPQRIGVITSPEGAALKDFLKILEEAPYPVSVRIYPAQVQGREAAAQIAAGLRHFQRERPDVIVITRGGGSFEDLMPFNEEVLVRRVAAGAVPVISAVGHEVDITLCDRAADVRVPTPTAAAQRIVEALRGVEETLDNARGLLGEGMLALCGDQRALLEARRARVSPRALKRFMEGIRERLRAHAAGLKSGARGMVRSRCGKVEQHRRELVRRGFLFAPGLRESVHFFAHRLLGIRQNLCRGAERTAFLKRSLGHLNVRGTLKRGYAILRKEDRSVIRSEAHVRPMESIEAQLYDGRLICRVQEKKKD